MTKITNAIALSIAIENLSGIPALNDAQGLNQISDEEKAAVIERLTAMFDSTVKRAEIAEQTFAVMSERPDFLFECKMLADSVGVSTPKMARVLASLVEVGKVKRIEGKKPNFKVKGE